MVIRIRKYLLPTIIFSYIVKFRSIIKIERSDIDKNIFIYYENFYEVISCNLRINAYDVRIVK